MIKTSRRSVKQCVILSGKGGTGKTSLCASLMQLSSQSTSGVFVDADVDAANLALVTKTEQLEMHPFSGSKLAKINTNLCEACGSCYDVCRFDAVIEPLNGGQSYQINELICEGCAACVHACPQRAIHMEVQQDGEWFHSLTPYGHLFHAELFPAAENTGKLVTNIKQHAKLYAEDHGYPFILVDGPPGIGCPVISASSGADLALLVAEPGVSGIHDLLRIIQTLEHFQIPVMILVNKADLYPEGTQEIYALANAKGYKICGEIPFEDQVPKAMLAAQPITQYYPNCPASKAIGNVWGKIILRLMGTEEEDV